MFSASEMNQALVKAFNISVCYNNIINTNLKVQNVHRGLRNKDHIVISFDKSMDADQCMKYLDNMKGRIVETFCGNESTASLSFDMKSFPFNFNRSQLVDSNGKYRFSVPIGQSIVFNLKCLLANGLARDITGAMGRNFGLEHVEEYTSDESFDRKSYLYCMRFYDKRLQEYFIESFSATVKGYKNSPKRTDDFLKVKDNCVYIKKSLFDKTKFINEIEESQACLIGRDLQTSSSDDPAVEKIKYLITGFIRKPCPPLYYVFHTSYSGNNEDSILVPIVSYDNYYRFLTKEEVDTVNSSFGMVVLNNIESYTSPKHLPVFGSRGIYGIDFSNPHISHCVITKIMESSVINKDHELAIDPELVRALSPVQSQVGMPNGPSSGLTELSSPIQEFPTRDQNVVLKDSPRQGSEKEALYNHVNPDGPSKGFSPSPQLNSIAVSYGVSGPSSSLQSVGAAQNVRAGTNPWAQPIGAWSSPAPSAEPSSWQPSRPSSSKGANPLGTNPWAQQTDRWSLPAPSAGLWSLPQSGPSSSKGANPVGTNPWAQQTNHWSSLKDADKDAKTTWYVPLPLTTGNDPLQVTDKSVQGARGEPLAPLASDENDRESSDECSEAKSQKSESPKKHGSSFQKVKDFFSSPFKSKQHDVSLKRCDVGRDTTQSMPTISVTKKSPLSERSASERKAKSNPPSKVTSPVHSTINGSIPGLPSQGTTVVESSSGPKRQTSLTPSQRKELYKVLSDEMKGKLNSSSFPPEYEELLYLLCVDKRELRLLLSDPKAKQVCSVLPPEKIEQVQSSSPEEVLRLLHTFFSNQKISDNFLISSKVDSPKTEKHLQKEREVFV